MITALLLSAIGLALLRRKTSGVGRIPKPKRNVYAELEYLQSRGVNFSGVYQPGYKNAITDAIRYFKWKPTASVLNNYPDIVEGYFKQLQRVYKKLSPIGSMPHTTSTVKNSDGDVILTYNHYDHGADWKNAVNYFRDELMTTGDDYLYGFYATVDYIAFGGRFIWSGGKSKDGERRLKSGIADEIANSNGDRKAFINIIASEAKGGKSIDAFTHMIAENTDSLTARQDDMEVRNGVLDAIRSYPSQAAAQQYILGVYYDYWQETHDYDPGNPEEYDLARYSSEEERLWDEVKESNLINDYGGRLL